MPSYGNDHSQIRKQLLIASGLLVPFQNPNWLQFTAFVAFNLLQSSISAFVRLEIPLQKLGVGAYAFAPKCKLPNKM